MIKKYKEFIEEGLLRHYNRWHNGDKRKEDDVTIRMNNFINSKSNPKNFYIKDNKLCSKDGVIINNDDLIDGKLPFKFGDVEGRFIISRFCDELTSLEGSPDSCGEYYVHSVKTLEGITQNSLDINCGGCDTLISLKGLPKELAGHFGCSGCKSLTSLEGSPEIVHGTFNCSDCTSLKSLEHLPKLIEGHFICYGCGKEFDESDIPEGTIIKGRKIFKFK